MSPEPLCKHKLKWVENLNDSIYQGDWWVELLDVFSLVDWILQESNCENPNCICCGKYGKKAKESLSQVRSEQKERS